MNIQQDFKEFLQLLDDFAVEYMIGCGSSALRLLVFIRG